ncbi:hypothetical protein AAVH_07347 [Aphelenchoides avenae]|nr:hypothetical protein AAVH_07347 [Aphelenchus avenae]
MWRVPVSNAKIDTREGRFYDFGVWYSETSVYVEAELCRDPNCSVPHVFPIDVVFTVRNKGRRKHWELAEDETLEKRHMSELAGKLGSQNFDVSVVRVWSGLQGVMQRQGTHLQPHELVRFERLIEQRMYVRKSLTSTSGGDDDLIKGSVKRYMAAFEHLMFDLVYLVALRRSQLAGGACDTNYGTEHFHPGQTCPIVPAGLTPSQRAQWIQDFTALMAYEDFTTLMQYAREEQLDAAVARPLAAARLSDANAPSSRKARPSKLAILRKVNQHVFEKNKKLACENAAMERKADRIKAAFRSLVAKVESQTGAKVAAGDPTQRVSEAVKLLLLRTANAGEDKENSPRGAQIQMLSGQLQKLNDANAALQNELAELRKKLKEIRLQKKGDKTVKK